MTLIKINWNPNCKDLRKFGVTVLVGFLLIGGLIFLKNSKAAYWTWAIGIAIGGTGLTGLKIALPFYWVWMGIAFVTGNIMSRVLMGMIFVVVVTPLALLMKLIRRDRLNLRRSDKSSYWSEIKPHGTTHKSYERQF